MGKRRRAVIFVAACGVTLLATLVWALLRTPARAPEPVYQGKPLSYWMLAYEPSTSAASASNKPPLAEAEIAIHRIGTNAIPILLEMLRANDPPLKTKALTFISKISFLRIRYTPSSEINSGAMLGFEVLGHRAVAAVPELVKIIDQQISPNSEICAMGALDNIGPDAEPAVPSLLKAATNSNDLVRGAALCTLGKIHSDPDKVVPVLMNALHDPWTANRANAASSLAEFREDAEPSVPALVALFNDPNVNSNSVSPPVGFTNLNVRWFVADALKRIDPDTYAKIATNKSSTSSN